MLPLLWFVGCASSQSAHDEAFREIQVREAALARASQQLAASGPCAPSMVGAERSICASSRELCELSRELHDPDASRRCLHASDTCNAAREHTYATCATQAR